MTNKSPDLSLKHLAGTNYYENVKVEKCYYRVVLAEDTAARDGHQVDHAVSWDPSQPGTAVYEAGCMCLRRNLAALHYDALLSDTLDLGQLETDIPINTNIKYEWELHV